MLAEFARGRRSRRFRRAADPGRLQRDRRRPPARSCARRSTGCVTCARRCASPTACGWLARPGRAQLPGARSRRRAERDGAGLPAGARRRREGRRGEMGAVAATDAPAAAAVLQGGRPEARSLVGALAEMWTRGASVDWAAMLREPAHGRWSCPPTRSSAGATGSRARRSTAAAAGLALPVQWKPIALGAGAGALRDVVGDPARSGTRGAVDRHTHSCARGAGRPPSASAGRWGRGHARGAGRLAA